MDDRLSRALQLYLGQYSRAIRRRRILEKRLKAVCQEMDTPIGGLNYSPVNYSSGNISVGSAAFTLRKSEIEARIKDQKAQAEVDLLRIMDILEYLDQNSDERTVLELRYIDMKSWGEIGRVMHLSRSSCFNYRDKGLETLLTFKRVVKIIEEYAEKRGI